MSAFAKCKTCGKAIVYADIVKADGTPGKIPLDMVAPCYRIKSDGDVVVGERAQDVRVSHFATCPQASQHSKRGGAAT